MAVRRRGRRWGVPEPTWQEPPHLPQRTALQPERTALAWQRTLLACALAVVPMTVAHVLADRAVLLVATGLLMLGMLPAVQVLGARPRQIRMGGWHCSPWPRLLGLAVAVCCVALLGAVTAVGQLLGAG